MECDFKSSIDDLIDPSSVSDAHFSKNLNDCEIVIRTNAEAPGLEHQNDAERNNFEIVSPLKLRQ